MPTVSSLPPVELNHEDFMEAYKALQTLERLVLRPALLQLNPKSIKDEPFIQAQYMGFPFILKSEQGPTGP